MFGLPTHAFVEMHLSVCSLASSHTLRGRPFTLPPASAVVSLLACCEGGFARLAGNNIGDAGCEALARALPQMASLSTLDLGGERLARSLFGRMLGSHPCVRGDAS